jgi:hypothetical protein
MPQARYEKSIRFLFASMKRMLAYRSRIHFIVRRHDFQWF